jgi:hypothetical protein
MARPLRAVRECELIASPVWRIRHLLTSLPQPQLRLCGATAPTMSDADLSATFFNLARFRAEGHKFAVFAKNRPKHPGGALLEHLIQWGSWEWSRSQSDVCHVMHNPTYTACRTSGNFWFDSPVFEQTGCYSSNEFNDAFGFDAFDLQYIRENAFCMRHKEENYQALLNSSSSL